MADPIPSSPTLLDVDDTSLEHVDSMQDEGLSLILAQLAGKPRFEALIKGLADGAQDVEDALWQLYTERWIETAEGEQLDGLGTVVGLSRGGRSDDVYRAWIYGRILVLRSNGTWRALLEMLAALGTEAASVRYLPEHPAGFVALLDDELPPGATGPDVHAMLDEARAGGVRLWTEYPAVGAARETSFRYAGVVSIGDGDPVTTIAGDPVTTIAGDPVTMIGTVGDVLTGGAGAGYGSLLDPDVGGFYGGAHASEDP